MKINAISTEYLKNNIRVSENNKERAKTSNIKDIRESNYYPSSYYVNFYGNKNKKEGINYKLRRSQLKDLGISKEYIDKISKYPKEQYEKALKLLESGCYEECVEEMSKLPVKRYKMAVNLVEHNVIDENIFPLVELSKQRYNRIIDLKDKGIDAKDLEIFAQLTPKQFALAKKMMKKGFYPIDAAYLSTLNLKQRKSAEKMLSNDINVEIAANISSKSSKQQKTFNELLQNGVTPEYAEEISELDDEKQKLFRKFLKLGCGDENSTDLAKLNKIQSIKAELMLQDGVHPDYIEVVISEEEKEDKNSAYKEYRNRGYSRTSAFSIALMEENEIDALIEIMEMYPEIKDLFKEEYGIKIINLQDYKTPGAILTKQQMTPDGTIIKLIHSLDTEGNYTLSRTEEYPNHSTSSSLKDVSDVFRLKYDRFGDIKEMTEFIQHPETREVTGVLYTTASKLLPGVFETVYYDINDFITNNDDETAIDTDIKSSVKNKGIPISSVTKKDNGTIVFTEKFNLGGVKTMREYTEKKDDEGNITHSSYSIKIKDEKGKTILNTSRSYAKTGENSSVSIINGIKYDINYNDEDKSIIISDGTKKRKLDFDNKLAYYSKEEIWKTAKQLPADTLLTVFDNIKQWNFCRTQDSVADGYCDILSTGKSTSVIQHETGHFKDYEIDEISNNKSFIKIYSEEMQNFADNMPHNEYDFITYLSPRADLIEANGRNEFVAESNIVLTSYGTNANKLKTRSQFLARYFPKSLAKVAELAGKNSTKSLLDK